MIQKILYLKFNPGELPGQSLYISVSVFVFVFGSGLVHIQCSVINPLSSWHPQPPPPLKLRHLQVVSYNFVIYILQTNIFIKCIMHIMHQKHTINNYIIQGVCFYCFALKNESIKKSKSTWTVPLTVPTRKFWIGTVRVR